MRLTVITVASLGLVFMTGRAKAISDGAQCSPVAPGLPGSPEVAQADLLCTDHPGQHACRPGPGFPGWPAPWYCMNKALNCAKPYGTGAEYKDVMPFPTPHGIVNLVCMDTGVSYAHFAPPKPWSGGTGGTGKCFCHATGKTDGTCHVQGDCDSVCGLGAGTCY